jgi:uracil-DNA glycosylase
MPYHSSWTPLFEKHNIDLNSLYITEVYPPIIQVYRVFEMPVDEIRVVLLGQDPYHGLGQAHGLSFSVPDGVTVPPSLRNIYNEVRLEFPERIHRFEGGSLEKWHSTEKIFLLNSSLTVVRGKPGTHMKEWEEFTDDVIRFISSHNSKCVFLLLGNFAKTKSKFILQKDKIVQGIHPSPMARGFVGSGVLKKVEKALGETVCWNNI